jgi:hypothetical protein
VQQGEFLWKNREDDIEILTFSKEEDVTRTVIKYCLDQKETEI